MAARRWAVLIRRIAVPRAEGQATLTYAGPAGRPRAGAGLIFAGPIAGGSATLAALRSVGETSFFRSRDTG
jgi:hypothetical protein